MAGASENIGRGSSEPALQEPQKPMVFEDDDLQVRQKGVTMTKEELRSYRALAAERRQLEALLEEIESSLYSAKVQRLTGMPLAPGSGESGSAQERLADRTMELRARYARNIAELSERQLAIEQAIDALPSTMRQLLRARYIEGLAWEDVCVRMRYSWRQTHRLHAEALRRLRASE